MRERPDGDGDRLADTFHAEGANAGQEVFVPTPRLRAPLEAEGERWTLSPSEE